MTPTYIYGFEDSILEVVLHEPPPDVPEALLHDIWRNQRLQTGGLMTVGGIPITVFDPGIPNTDAGPDFLQARLRLGTTTWTGAVEIHTTSGVWEDHGHHRDARYNSTLLHVVLYSDIWTGKLRRADGTVLPELILYPHLESPLRRLIHSFYTRPDGRILCASGWSRVPDALRESYLKELAQERMIAKAHRFRAAGDADTAFYEAVFAGLGYAKNTSSMRTLAKIVPLDAVRSLSDSADVEALFLGAAGMLPKPSELLETDRETADYVIDLCDRFERLNHRFDIVPMPATAWRFFRLRPANFPTLRIAQAAALFHMEDGILRTHPIEKLRRASASQKPVQALRTLFDVKPSPFWQHHVRLHKRTSRRNPSIGGQRIDALIVNVVIPALLAGGASERIYALLEQLPPTEDEITRHFASLGTRPATAGVTQGLHQLYASRCSEARCLSCAVGRSLLESGE